MVYNDPSAMSVLTIIYVGNVIAIKSSVHWKEVLKKTLRLSVCLALMV